MFLCSPCESNIFGARAIFTMDAYHIFSQCMLTIIPLIEDMIVVVVTRDSTGYWEGAPLCSVTVTAPSGAYSSSHFSLLKPPDPFLSCSVM